MYKNYLITAIRNIRRNRVFSFITIFGLAAGLTCALLILVFVMDEYSYDQFHSKYDRIYRVRYKIQSFDIARIPPVIKKNLNSFFPEVEESSRFFSRAVSIKVKNPENGRVERFEEDNVNFADPEIFKIFDFELIQGSLAEALKQPFTVILNEETAIKYFGSTQLALGQEIEMENGRLFKIIAVVNDFPSNSHIHFDMILPYENMFDLEREQLAQVLKNNLEHNWMVSHSPTYVLLKEGADKRDVDAAFPKFIKSKFPQEQQIGQSFELQELSDIHLNDEVVAQAEPPSNPEFILIFGIIGVLTLLIACINFVNLNTAKYLERAKEIGMRKVLGAWKSNIIAQFMGESFIITIFSGLVAVLFVMSLLPLLNSLTDKSLEPDVLLNPEMIFYYILTIIFTAILAGFYPSFFVSRFAPIKSLKKEFRGNGNLSFRRILIITQFVISIVLITGALIVRDQLNFLNSAPLGFNKDLTLIVPLQSQNFNSVFGGVDQEFRRKMNTYEDEISSIPGVTASTASSTAPGFESVNRRIVPEGFTEQDNLLCSVFAVDYDFTETYDMKLLNGRTFSKDHSTDLSEAFLINERAVESFNFKNPEEAIGKTINLEGKIGKVIGVVKDFHFQPLLGEIDPLILEINVPQFSVFSIKIAAQNITETIENLESVWNNIFPDKTFEYEFLDDALAQNYLSQERLRDLITYFAVLAIIISCLGSYGMIMFITSRKQKEIGIRKVLGAEVTSLVFLLSRRFIFLAIIAILIAAPLSIYLSNYWLEDFSYRVGVSPFSIILASAFTLILVLATVSIQSLKTAYLNPVDVLKDE